METTVTADIYSPRWGHTDKYSFIFSDSSLTVRMAPREAVCRWVDNADPVWEGEPLSRMLVNDHIHQPEAFPDLLEHAWKSWKNGDINSDQLDAEIQALITWLNKITESKPRTDFWNKYF